MLQSLLQIMFGCEGEILVIIVGFVFTDVADIIPMSPEICHIMYLNYNVIYLKCYVLSHLSMHARGHVTK